MNCRLCNANSLKLCFDFGNKPIVHRLLTNEKESYETYPFRISVCDNCGLMQMTDYINPTYLYSNNYFTVSGWKKQTHSMRLVQLIQKIYGTTRDSKIFEIGCNDGSFMEEMVKAGFVNISGVEPAPDAFILAREKGLDVTKGFFSDSKVITDNMTSKYDVVIARQVFEHIPNLLEFIDSIYNVMTPSGGLVIEVPDHSMNYENLDYTFWEEHVNYFTLGTLTQLLRSSGFSIIHYETTLFSGKALTLYAQKGISRKSISSFKNFDAESIRNYLTAFSPFKKEIRGYLDSYDANGIVVYGAGARSCNFINLLELADQIAFFVDDQSAKQHKFIPGCMKKIEPFSREKITGKLVVLGVNSENEQDLIASRQLEQYISILPPSRHLPAFWQNFLAKH
jgi:2-polyprenyl-3-methyl-5-hydroxy-6-metoxy-1,4-benzoquinol methylase